MAVYKRTYIIWVLWVCMGILWAVDGAHRRSKSSYGNPRNNDVLTPPSGLMVEALRLLLNVPADDVRGGFSPSTPQPRPPRYMLNLYRRISQGDSSLPRHANTVRSFKPTTAGGEMLLFNVSAVAKEQVLGTWLHLKGSSGRDRVVPRLRPTRVLVYLLPESVSTSFSSSSPSTPSASSSSSGKDSMEPPMPIMTHSLSPHQQEIELTRGVREVTEKTGNARSSNGQLGIKVEELRRGRYVPRSLEKLTRRPPLLFVYSSDPTLLDLAALGAAALNVSKDRYKHGYGQSSAHYKRYTREAIDEMDSEKEALQKSKRSIGEDEWTSPETEESPPNNEGASESHVEHHPLLTNELPFGDHFDESPFLPKSYPSEESEPATRRHHRRRRKKNHRRRKDDDDYEDDDSLIPLPENYSKTKWGEKETRRKNKRRRRNRKLPDEWMAAAQNKLSNDANSLNYRASSHGGGPTSHRPCDKHKLEVNFKTLGWDHWIVAPAGFDAFYCAGVCPNPLTKQMSGSNHAIIQSMIYSMGLRPEVPAPCCVPEKLDSITLLSMDGEDRFILKNYSKMIVTSCSCQ